MKSSVKTDFVAPIAILTIICLVMSALLAVINNVTDPIIKETEARIAEEARIEVLPDATGFELVDVELPSDSSVTEVYKATNDVGYVFMITCTGYGGKDTMKLICSIDNDGKIVYSKTLAHEETAGLGSKTAGDDFRFQFCGQDSSLSGVSTITGATRSSNFYIAGIKSAFAAYDIVKEAE